MKGGGGGGGGAVKSLFHIDGVVQDCSNYSTLAMDKLRSFIYPLWKWFYKLRKNEMIFVKSTSNLTNVATPTSFKGPPD